MEAEQNVEGESQTVMVGAQRLYPASPVNLPSHTYQTPNTPFVDMCSWKRTVSFSTLLLLSTGKTHPLHVRTW